MLAPEQAHVVRRLSVLKVTFNNGYSFPVKKITPFYFEAHYPRRYLPNQ